MGHVLEKLYGCLIITSFAYPCAIKFRIGTVHRPVFFCSLIGLGQLAKVIVIFYAAMQHWLDVMDLMCYMHRVGQRIEWPVINHHCKSDCTTSVLRAMSLTSTPSPPPLKFVPLFRFYVKGSSFKPVLVLFSLTSSLLYVFINYLLGAIFWWFWQKVKEQAFDTSLHSIS